MTVSDGFTGHAVRYKSSNKYMLSKSIRWLHISDFHVGKDNYGQRQIFKYVLDDVESRIASAVGPDFVFITGDIANRGLLTEYEYFIDGFVYPLMELMGDNAERIFIIPGNHDVDRNQAKAVQAHTVLSKVSGLLDPTPEGSRERKILLPRFKDFVQAGLPATGAKWLDSSPGAFVVVDTINGLQVGIIGLNTAWLSENDDDKKNLSPGKDILETGLQQIKDCDLKIVLGHHPIDWFIENEIKPISSLFGKNHVLYLHGHLHKNASSPGYGAGHPFLAIQAGAAFQAREDERWVNRLLWCELDFTHRLVRIEPRQWSRDHKEWAIDGLAFPEAYREPGTDRWSLPLPISPESSPAPVDGVVRGPKATLPGGWRIIDSNFLDEHRVPLIEEHVIRYFDGRVPTWQDALSEQIPKRTIVQELVSDFYSSHEKKELQITLLLGAGGEGKSTVLRQVLCEIVESGIDVTGLWHNNPDSPLPAGALVNLPKSTTGWLVCSDDADLVANDIFNEVRLLHEAGRDDVKFMLTCRDTDWKGAKGDQMPWGQYATLNIKRLSGLSPEDAALIVKTWSNYGTQGMGRLDKLSLEDATVRLLRESKSEKYTEEGAFLGAMLRSRIGEDIKAHVTALLLRLNKRPAPNGTLMNAFAYIAALHAENFLILTKEILAGALGIRLRDVKKEVIAPLGDEAAASTAGHYVLTRHRAIAETAVEVLSDNFDLDFDEIYMDLVRSTNVLALAGKTIRRLGDWNKVGAHFFKKGNQSLGLRLAEMIVEMFPTNPYLLTEWAKLLRLAGEEKHAIQLFQDSHKSTRNDRGLYLEWSTSERTIQHFAVASWLAGIALADGASMKRLDFEKADLALKCLAITFWELFDRSQVPIFITACRAAVQLGSMLPESSQQTTQFYQTYKIRTADKGVHDVAPAMALKNLETGVINAWDHQETELPNWIRDGSALTFHELAQLLGLSYGSVVETSK
jgi:predicted phosphodiesterase